MKVDDIRKLVKDVRVCLDDYRVDFEKTVQKIKKEKDLSIVVNLGDEKKWTSADAFDISGYAKKDDSHNYTIELNPFDPENRGRFTLAHEIGHILLGHFKDDISEIRDKKDNEFEVNVSKEKKFRSVTFDKKDKEEVAANEFAAELLMPYEKVHSLFTDNKISYKDVLTGVGKFQVSETAMITRFRFLGYHVAFI